MYRVVFPDNDGVKVSVAMRRLWLFNSCRMFALGFHYRNRSPCSDWNKLFPVVITSVINFRNPLSVNAATVWLDVINELVKSFVLCSLRQINLQYLILLQILCDVLPALTVKKIIFIIINI